jgi:hypothetical protein
MSSVSILNPICRGIVGHVSYLAACDLSTVYSEYLLYEPITRIAKSHDYDVSCEVPVGARTNARGDHQRIDFKFTNRIKKRTIALEVKWWRTKGSRNVMKDIEKLKASNCDDRFLIIFGRYKMLTKHYASLSRDEKLRWDGKIVHWNAGKTHYAANWIRVTV